MLRKYGPIWLAARTMSQGSVLHVAHVAHVAARGSFTPLATRLLIPFSIGFGALERAPSIKPITFQSVRHELHLQLRRLLVVLLPSVIKVFPS